MSSESKFAGLIALTNSGVKVPVFFYLSLDDLRCQFSIEELKCRIDKEEINISNGVSIRSSFHDEDTNYSSAAGKYESINGLRSIQSIFTSLLKLKDRAEEKYGNIEGGFVIQETHVPIFSGVAYKTVDSIYLECFWGNCRTVVDGLSTPYRAIYKDHKWTTVEPPDEISLFYANKKLFHNMNNDYLPGNRVICSDEIFMNSSRVFQSGAGDEILLYGYPPKIDKSFIIKLLEPVIEEISKINHCDNLDIEWGMSRNFEDINFYQARPIVKEIKIDEMRSEENSIEDCLQGIAAAPGKTSGFVTHDKSNCEGKVLMVNECEFDNLDVFKKPLAIITKKGGLLSHMSALCREYGLPCVTGLNVTIEENEFVNICGKTGEVTLESA